MNERIEKLWDEAADSIASIPNGRNNFWETQENFMEKFAELIVQECAKIAEKEQAFNARYTDADKHPQVNIDQCILIEFGL